MAEVIAKAGTNCTESLYEICISSIVSKLNYNQQTLNDVKKLRYLSPGVLIDVYSLMLQRDGLTDMLFEELADLEIVERLLRFGPARQKLLLCLVTLINRGKQLALELKQKYIGRSMQELLCVVMKTQKTTASTSAPSTASIASITKTALSYKSHNHEKNTSTSDNNTSPSELTSTLARTTQSIVVSDCALLGETLLFDETDSIEDFISSTHEKESENSFDLDAIKFGLRLGSFLSEAGWLADGIDILKYVAVHLSRMPTEKVKIIYLDCLNRLLHSETCFSNFKDALCTYNKIMDLINHIPNSEDIPKPLLISCYTRFAEMRFARNEYEESHIWSLAAVRILQNSTPERIAIDAMRQAVKACVVKRQFQRAKILIYHAKSRAKRIFGDKHQKYADTLLDYGYFLLNVDEPRRSVAAYKDALDIKRCVFGTQNFHVAIAHEELSYAYYVHEYSTGNFFYAYDHVEKAVAILRHFVPEDHLKMASAKRVKALLLEELALDKMAEGADEEGLLKQSEDLHNFALQLSLEVFGEKNVQTAKLYGNLGRLYQTMTRFEEAECMHQKAIKIKTDILGPFDYEVGLSIGHLASLYNYQMKKYREAEELYLRSIKISLHLFGGAYSGLEYDYLGLCHVYDELREYEKYLKYANMLDNWQILRQNLALQKTISPAINEHCSLEDIKKEFLDTRYTCI